jgi:hypothetical protein
MIDNRINVMSALADAEIKGEDVIATTEAIETETTAT